MTLLSQCGNPKASNVTAGQKPVDNDNGCDQLAFAALQAASMTAQGKTQDEHLTNAGDGAFVVTTALNEMMTSSGPKKVLSFVTQSYEAL